MAASRGKWLGPVVGAVAAVGSLAAGLALTGAGSAGQVIAAQDAVIPILGETMVAPCYDASVGASITTPQVKPTNVNPPFSLLYVNILNDPNGSFENCLSGGGGVEVRLVDSSGNVIASDSNPFILGTQTSRRFMFANFSPSVPFVDVEGYQFWVVSP